MRLFPPRQRARTARQFAEHTTVEKRRGRVETRRLRTTTLLNGYLDWPSNRSMICPVGVKTTTLLNGYLDWPGVARVCCVEREVKRHGKEPSREVAYAITSVPAGCAGPATLLGWWRGHWGIENRSHYVRDVSMGEDASRISSGAAPQVMAAFRNAAVGYFRCRGVVNAVGYFRCRGVVNAVGYFRCRGVVNVAEALRRNAARVRPLLMSLGIVKQ